MTDCISYASGPLEPAYGATVPEAAPVNKSPSALAAGATRDPLDELRKRREQINSELNK